MKAADIFNKITNWKKKEENITGVADLSQEETIERLEATVDDSSDGVHKALDALISIKDNPKPISLQRERIDAIKSNVSQSQIANAPYTKSEGRPEGKKEIIGRIIGRIKVEDIKNRQKMQKGYIKHYSGYFSGLKAEQFEIKPRVISKITAYISNILRHFKEVYKNEHE